MARFDPARPTSAVAVAALIGVVAGLLAATFLTVSAEPSIDRAIRIEHARATVTGAAPERELVSRGEQKGVGLFGAYALTGAGFGVLFAATFLLLGRTRMPVFRRALVAGGVLAGALTVSPWVKYPPNPPAVGDPGTLGRRQFLYVSVIVLTVLVLAGLVWLAGRLRDAGWDDPHRVAAVVGAGVVVLLAVYALLPPAPDPVTVPATLVWRFRLASLGGNLLLWTGLTLGFAVAA